MYCFSCFKTGNDLEAIQYNDLQVNSIYMQFCLLYAPLLTKTMVHVYSLLFDIYFRCIPVPAAATCIYAFSNFNTLFFQTKFQSLMYQNVLAAQYRNSLANELMMYHMKVTR